ncbi:hypothetical protein SOVF_126820 [Spinacia oleracea]|nr:hypothetical protein SOVF_126820 [Spinacia oleracea]
MQGSMMSDGNVESGSERRGTQQQSIIWISSYCCLMKQLALFASLQY